MFHDDDFLNDDNSDLQPSAERFEAMVKNHRQEFFDSDTLEELFDYFITAGKMELAAKVAEFGTQHHPFQATFLLKKAQLCLALGQPESAFPILDDAQALEPTNFEVYLLRGTALQIMGNFREAIRMLHEAEQCAEDQIEMVYLALAHSFLEWEKHNSALYYFQLYLNINSQDTAVLDDLSWCFVQLNDSESGIQFYKSFLDREPYSDEGWYQLSNLYNRQREFEKALDALEFCLAINDKHPLALYTKANIYLNMERFADALQLLQSAHQEDPNNAAVVCGIGVCYEKLNSINEAWYWYRRSTDLDPQLPDGWFGQGICALLLEQYPAAERCIRKAIELNPQVEEFWYSLSEVYENIEQYDKAEACYHEALRLDKDFFEARIDFAILLMEQLNRPQEALEWINEGLELHPTEPEFLYRYAGVMLDWGKESQAIDALQLALSLDFSKHPLLFEYSEDAEFNLDVIRLIEQFRI